MVEYLQEDPEAQVYLDRYQAEVDRAVMADLEAMEAEALEAEAMEVV